MFKPEQIPDRSADHFAYSLYRERLHSLSPEERDQVRSRIRTAFAAGLAAWPGAWHVDAVDFEPKLILPLTQESSNGSD